MASTRKRLSQTETATPGEVALALLSEESAIGPGRDPQDRAAAAMLMRRRKTIIILGKARKPAAVARCAFTHDHSCTTLNPAHTFDGHSSPPIDAICIFILLLQRHRSLTPTRPRSTSLSPDRRQHRSTHHRRHHRSRSRERSRSRSRSRDRDRERERKRRHSTKDRSDNRGKEKERDHDRRRRGEKKKSRRHDTSSSSDNDDDTKRSVLTGKKVRGHLLIQPRVAGLVSSYLYETHSLDQVKSAPRLRRSGKRRE